MNLSSALNDTSWYSNEAKFAAELPSILYTIFLAEDGLLNILDNALYDYNIKRAQENNRRRSSGSVFSFFGGGGQSEQEYNYDANYSNKIEEL